MSAGSPAAADVAKATANDRDFILRWLQSEHREDGFGFWSNRHIVEEAHDEDELWVVRDEGDAVAFQVGNHAAVITSVRKDRRGGGFGTALFEAALERAIRDGVNVLEAQCSPESSLGFWQRMGFERYDDRRRPNEVRVRRVLAKTFELPPGLPRVEVTVTFLPEQALYSGGGDLPPTAVHRIEGALRPDGSIMLARRALGLTDDEPNGDDLAVRIEVDGVERILAKGKYADDAGVVRDWQGDAFYVDVIPPPGTGEGNQDAA